MNLIINHSKYVHEDYTMFLYSPALQSVKINCRDNVKEDKIAKINSHKKVCLPCLQKVLVIAVSKGKTQFPH